MAKNVQKPNSHGVKKGGGALIGGGALNGEFTVFSYQRSLLAGIMKVHIKKTDFHFIPPSHLHHG